MKLSMWILRDWLKDYSPTSIISDGAMSIENVLMLPCEMPNSDSSLYIGRMHDLFPNTKSDEIVLMCRNDVISLNTSELIDVFNSVSGAFAFYNDWESRIAAASEKDKPEQSVIDECEGVLGPIFILNTDIDAIAISQYTPKGSVNRVFDELTEQGYTSTELVKAVYDGPFFTNFSHVFNGMVYHDPRVGAYDYSIIYSYVGDDGGLLGHLLVLSDSEPDEKQKQLAGILSDTLNAIKKKPARSTASSVVENSLRLLLESYPADERRVSLLLKLHGWSCDDSFNIFCFHSKKQEGLGMQPKLLTRNIKRIMATDAVIQIDDAFYCCIDREHSENMIQSAEECCRSFKLCMGISAVYEGLGYAAWQREQSHLACLNALIMGVDVRYFFDSALDIMILTDDGRFRELCMHPAITRIREYDRLHGTALLNTLKAYLRNERSPLLTSQEMHVHKNTVINRVERITELAWTQFDDPYDREYMLVSLRVLELMESDRAAATDTDS